MPTHPLTKRFPKGTTHRITVSTVRDQVCDFATDTPETLSRYWHEVIAAQPDHEPDKESLVVVMLTTRMRPFAWHRVSLGTVAECSAHPREIMRPVIAAGAYSFTLMHNHPSGDPSPSEADLRITRRIVEAGELMHIPLLDHVIIDEPAPGRTGYFSFRECGVIK
jgi:DNA repair protein RadC